MKFVLALIGLMFLMVNGVLAGCETSISNGTFLIDSSVNIQLSVKNNGTENITMIKIPTDFGSVLSISNVTLMGWSVDTPYGAYVFTGVLPAGQSVNFQVTGQASSTETSNSWTPMATESDESGYFSCNSVDLVAVGSLPTPIPITIEGVVLTVNSNSATISWQNSSSANSYVNYGLTTEYGSRVDGNGTVTISNLQPSTNYHFQIVSSNGVVTSSTNDNSFTTSSSGSTTITSSTPSVSVVVAATPTPKPLVDTVPPKIIVTTDFSKPFLASPAINGKAIDSGDTNVGIAKLEYSIDGGRNWLPIESMGNNFEFTPMNLDDGNYVVKIRATDKSGNVGVSKKLTMVIDRLPPETGGVIFSFGPMVIKPSIDGAIYFLSGLDLRMITSAVGGPVSMNLECDNKKFELIRNNENGLWSSNINLNEGVCIPIVKAIDGAKNLTERKLNKLVGVSKGKIVNEKNEMVKNSKISIYIYEKTTNDYVLWQSAPYLQTNPQITDNSGDYMYVLPPGKYYLEVESKGSQKLRSEIFEINKVTIINKNLVVHKQSWGNWLADTVVLNFEKESQTAEKSELIGRQLPEFDLGEINNLTLLGKPTVVTFLTSWEPQSSWQLLALDKFKNENEGVNVVPILIQESRTKTEIFRKIGNYKLSIVADADGKMVNIFNLEMLPAHIFVDRKGIIKDINNDFLDKNNLLKRILN